MKNKNIALFFFATADKFCNDDALFYKGRPELGEINDESLTFAELGKIVKAYACEFRKAGVRSGDKTLLLLRYSPEFICSVFALFSIGAVPVLIDPGMGIKHLFHCISQTSPRVLIGIPLVHWVRLFKRAELSSIELAFSTPGFIPPFSKIFRLPSASDVIREDYEADIEAVQLSDSDLAAIVFTTGSTGPAKGVEYTHGIFNTQLEIIKECYGAGPQEKDMPCFPLFAMFSLCLGMPCVIPDIDPSRPARAEPAKLFDTIFKYNITFSFASPTLWRNLSDYCIKKGIKLNSLKKVLMAGAPVSASLHQNLKKILPADAQVIVPYGATEALPVANFTGSEMLAETAQKTAEGGGYCVGYPVKVCEIRIIEITEKRIDTIEQAKFLERGEIGEIIVKGPMVTRAYHANQDATALAKIADGDNFWHRMGDAGFIDEKGRLWFCGRIKHRVQTAEQTLHTCIEEPFNIATGKRCALIGMGKAPDQIPVIVIEAKMSDKEFKKFIQPLFAIELKYFNNLRISHFARISRFPVDIRHNAKIRREDIEEKLNAGHLKVFQIEK